MCIYCNPDESIDVSNREIFHIKADCGFMGNIFSTLLIDRKNKKLEMVLFNDSEIDTVMKKTISYCPFCGEEI